MASLFEIGKTGVQAYRQALSVTGQNIANINSDGYNKRSANISEVAGASGGATNIADQSGLGVRIDGVRRSFDTFLSDKTRTTTSEFSKLDNFVTNLNQLEDMLLPDGSDLGTFIGRFFSSLQDIASRPDDLTARTVAIETGKSVANSFNSYDGTLERFKSSALKETNNKVEEVNLKLKQIAQINGLAARSGASNPSNDILDARDQLLLELSKLINFTVDLGKSGDAEIRLGDSGKGAFLVEKTSYSVLTASADEKNIVLEVNRNGIKSPAASLSKGIITGISEFYGLVNTVQNEVSQLASQFSDELNEIQVSGINLNGNSGKAMFSYNSMSPKINLENKSTLSVDIIEGNPYKIKQETINAKFVENSNSWQISDSKGIKLINGNKLNFEGFSIEINGKPQNGDKFTISPDDTSSGALKFILTSPEDFAAASKTLISADLTNTGSTQLNLLGIVNKPQNQVPSKLEDIFSNSSNPLLASSFLKDGPIFTIPTSTDSLILSSIGNQSSVNFSLFDNNVKSLSSLSITLANGTNVSLSTNITDPGKGPQSVEELADLLNAGLMLDGKSKHNFRTYGLYASGSNVSLTSASSISDITSGSIIASGNSFSPTISSITASSALASDIQVFTRDGRHVSGKALSSKDIAVFLKEENGFLKDAEYRNDYLNNDYRGMDLTRRTVTGDYVNEYGASISYAKQATDADGLFVSKSTTSLSGSLSLDGIQSVSNDFDSYVTITSSGNDTGINFSVVGYDLDGQYQTETITGGNATQVVGAKVFKSISTITSSGNASGNLTIGSKAVGYDLKTNNSNNTLATTSVPIGASANYIANKLKTDLAGTGINFNASTKAIIGPLKEGVSGLFSFKLQGKNIDSVSVSATIDASDLSSLGRVINQYTSQTGLKAVLTSDFDQLIIISEDGYDIEMSEIVAPSDFNIKVLNDNFSELTEDHMVDVSSSLKKSAYIRGTVKFYSTNSFTNQINAGSVKAATLDSLENGYLEVDRNSSGERVTVKPIVFKELDDNLSSSDGKKAIVGLSKYGLDINQKSYKVNVEDDDSLYTSNNPGGAGNISLNGQLRNANNLSAVVSIYCSASETGNVFTVTGTDADGTAITENISGVTSSNIAMGSTKFKSITSIVSSASASGNIKIGTVGRYEINDDDSLIENISVTSAGSLTMDGPLSTASYLGSKVKISSSTNTSSNSFLISGIDLNGKIISETITGSNSSSVISSNIFQKINSISVSGSISSMIKVGTVGSDGNWNVAIDANALEINSALEISSALASELRIGTPISQLKGEVVSKIPSEGSRVELSFEGQIYTAEIINGEVIVNGPESNRIKARLNGTSSLDIDAISSSQSGTASTALVLNGIEAVLSDQDGLVENQTIGSAGNLTISGALSTKASTLLNSLITISSVNNNASDTFTITGTDIDGVVQTETITGVNNNTVTGTKVFKTVTQIASNGATSGINVGTISVIANKDGTRVSISSMGNETKNSFTISGTDVDGLAQTETIFGANSGGTVYSSRLFKTISSITPTLSTNGNIQVGTAPGYQFIATAEGTVEGDQFRVVQNNSNLSFASGFGISSGIATLKGNLVPKPVNADEGIRINVKVGSSENKYTIKFDTNGVPQFYNRIGSSISASPPSGLSLAWNDVSGTTDDDALFNSNMSAGVSIVTNGALSTTDDDSLFTSKSSTAGNLILDGTLKSSQELNGIVTVFCAGNETGNSFKVSGYDMSGTYVTDTITGGNNSEVSGSVSFKEVLSINVSNDTASTIKVGTQATSVTFAPSSITVTPSGSDVGETYTVIGLDQFGRSQTEVLTAEAAGTTVYGKKVFSQVSSFLPTSGSASSVKVGTQAVGNLSLSHNVDSMSFSLDSNPNAEIQYGLKTQHTRLTFDTNGLNILNLSGEAVNLEVPLNSIQNSVAEQVTVKNLPNEELIAFVMGGGARKFSTEFDINENKENIIDPEVSIKVDSSNSNKIEIFDKMSGHSIGTRIIDQNRLFEFDGNKFQFSDQPLIKNNFIFSSNQSGTGDARNILNMLKLQLEDATNQGKGNFQQIFSNTVAKVGSNVQANKLSLAAASSNKDSAEASQSEFAGVNLDEEAGHLLEYQQAYQASARILQTARELFQSLLDVVGR